MKSDASCAHLPMNLPVQEGSTVSTTRGRPTPPPPPHSSLPSERHICFSNPIQKGYSIQWPPMLNVVGFPLLRPSSIGSGLSRDGY